MNSHPSRLQLRPELAFLMFALLLGARDVGAELIFKQRALEVALCFAFLICLTITTISLVIILRQRGLVALVRKIAPRHIFLRVLVVGGSAAIVYAVTFYMIYGVGAGYFDLFDYGLAPLLTAAIGIAFFGNVITKRLLLATLAYVAGVFLLLWHGTKGWAWIGIAVLSPVGTAVSDAMTKWLLSPEKGNLSRSELLFVRFLPATALIGLGIVLTGGGLHLHDAPLSIPLAVIGGFLPLWFLCTGLGRAALTKYAVWEFLIPAVAFFATLPLRPENRTLNSTFGAIIILMAVVIHEVKWPKSFKRSKGNKPDSSQPGPGLGQVPHAVEP